MTKSPHLRGQYARTEYVPAAPFVAWLQQQRARFAADDTLRLTEKTTVVPVELAVAALVGTSTRTIFRYIKGLDGNGDPTDRFPRCRVEDLLEHAEVRFEDVYPDEVADVELEPVAFCPTCEQAVNPIEGECPWCNTRTGKAPRGVRYNRPKARVSDHQLRSLHLLHVNCKLPILVLARQSHARLGYPHARAADRAIRRGWQRLGLKPLTQSQVMSAIAARKQQEYEPLLAADAFERAMWMHTEAGVSVEAIARLMVSESRVTFSGTLARWLRDELRARGVYSAKRGKLEAAA